MRRKTLLSEAHDEPANGQPSSAVAAIILPAVAISTAALREETQDEGRAQAPSTAFLK